jgi:hypothetical protein
MASCYRADSQDNCTKWNVRRIPDSKAGCSPGGGLPGGGRHLVDREHRPLALRVDGERVLAFRRDAQPSAARTALSMRRGRRRWHRCRDRLHVGRGRWRQRRCTSWYASTQKARWRHGSTRGSREGEIASTAFKWAHASWDNGGGELPSLVAWAWRVVGVGSRRLDTRRRVARAAGDKAKAGWALTVQTSAGSRG